jgi:hypothetical protein
MRCAARRGVPASFGLPTHSNFTFTYTTQYLFFFFFKARPELVLGVFKCDECATVFRNVRQEFTFTDPTVCTNVECMSYF